MLHGCNWKVRFSSAWERDYAFSCLDWLLGKMSHISDLVDNLRRANEARIPPQVVDMRITELSRETQTRLIDLEAKVCPVGLNPRQDFRKNI